MRAVVANLSVPRYLLTAAHPRLGRMLSLQDDWPEPELPAAPGWVRLRPELAGVCGSDVGVAQAKSSLVLSAFYTARHQILGHEIVAVTETGERVVVDPIVSCRHRGFPPCRSCQDGFPYVCERFDQPGVAGCRAPSLGFDATLGGGWGEVLVAHESQLHPVGDLPSRRAVLAEPASIALHAALHWPRRGDRAVVIGPGTIGRLVIAALRRLHAGLDITAVGPGRTGADRTLAPGPGVVETLAGLHGGRVIRPRLSQPLLEQGVDVVFDCVGLSSTIDLGLHLLRPSGMLVLVGGAGKQPVDWSLVWNRQLTVQGSVNFGPEPALGGRHTMAQVVEWLHDPAYPVDDLVTHTFGLPEWRTALDTAAAGPRASAVKVTLRPDPDLPLID
ncbi:alcohol dehydrogenase [Paractinoplanes abujensis]|uniref:Threonine dehydrogenase-like Zn-dependent dehydrogenase n=1 Tax=Paractinoplanes abujensis TaxID=882441 RepID=A0A7W7CM31_9ACTN|nr:zinc-binding dehydrogenase [Actinoplanes abujensis]MBB4691062.1 threonine dehydrogenase-like Zn-dependent dehydrogenase [Actinoplanes abujensis]GID17526.1 alcohol dehydrogenase [Actinoplanes abujensis]